MTHLLCSVMDILSVILMSIRQVLLWFIRAEINLSFLEILRSVCQTYVIVSFNFILNLMCMQTLLMEQLPNGWCLLFDKSVEVRNPQIQDKQNSESEQKWRPWTPRYNKMKRLLWQKHRVLLYNSSSTARTVNWLDNVTPVGLASKVTL